MKRLLVLFAPLVVACHHDAASDATQPAPVGSATLQSANVAVAPKGARPEGAAPPSDLPELPKAVAGAPVVGLDGTSRPWPTPIAENAPRIAALAIETPILAQPDVFAARLGLLRTGAIVEMDPTPVVGKGCQPGFRAIKPMGFVCLGSATLDLANPIVRASSRRPDVTEKLPYMYGMAVRGGPAYAKVPTDKEMKELEPHLQTHLAQWRKDDVSGASYGVELWGKWKKEPPPPALAALDERKTDDDIPWFVKDGLRVPNLSNQAAGDTAKAGEFARHNGIAFTDSFLDEGRRYNVAVDLRLYPADRFRPIKGSDFHGFRIPEEAHMPFAIVKGKKAQKLVNGPGGRLVPEVAIEWRSTVQLSGRQRVQKGKYFSEIEGGGWVSDDEISRVELAKKMPGWAIAGEKWIDIHISRQLLIMYEGQKPVYATLVSTGEAGLDDPKTTKSTARGVFRIHTKHVTATMDSKVVGEEFELRDVPYVQYFHEGYALHAAYWHDVFGMPKSHGCVNLAPEDARRIFFWTEPQVPDGWHAAAKARTGTVVFIHP